jgi:PAS domain S-box-containing protein
MEETITLPRAEYEKLFASEAIFREVADTAPALIWLSGIDALCTWFNKLWLDFRGRTMEQEVGNGWAEGVHKEDLGGCLDLYLSHFESRTPFQMEYRLRRADGEYRWMLDHGVPRFGEAGVFLGYIGSCTDINDIYIARQALLQAEKIAATGRMAATIAHEVNNPLEAVMNLIYLLRSKVTDEEGLTYLSTAESEITRVSHIAKQTLGYYREHAAASAASLSEIARQAVFIYESRCVAANILLNTSFHSSHRPVIRRGEMMQVVSNVIANSIYAMPQGGTIDVEVSDSEAGPEGVNLVVRDNGSGISQENLPKIFNAFFTTRATIGTGIGLFVAKQFIEGHGGKITVESNQGSDTHGTTVRVFLPLTTTYDGS